MTLPVNTAIALNAQIAQRLVAASLAGNKAHVLCINTPPGMDTATQLEALYARQYGVQLNISADDAIIPMLNRVQDAVTRADKESQPLVVIAACRNKAETYAITSMLSHLLENRKGTALVNVVTAACSEPTATHYLTLDDAKAATA